MDTEQIKSAVNALLEARKVLEESKVKVIKAQEVLADLYRKDKMPEWSIVTIDGVPYEVKMDCEDGSFDSLKKSNFYMIN